jgi:hypothetical protein
LVYLGRDLLHSFPFHLYFILYFCSILIFTLYYFPCQELASNINLLTHYAKGTLSFRNLVLTWAAYKITISTISLTVLFFYRLCVIFSFRERFPLIQTEFIVHFTFKAHFFTQRKSHLIFIPEVSKIFQFTSFIDWIYPRIMKVYIYNTQLHIHNNFFIYYKLYHLPI